ncbi:MAG: hypothetical protein AAGG07_06355 [Planctomycetota bacterium]
MHIFTKVLVCFAAVLAILLSALTMTYAASSNAITADYKDAVAARSAMERSLEEQTRQLTQVLQDTELEQATLNSALAERDAQVRRLQSENVRLLGEKRAAEASRDSIENQIAQLGETTQTQIALIESYRNEVGDLRSNELRFRNEKLQLEDRINDLESQREVLEQTTRALQEQLAELQTAISETNAIASGIGTESAATAIRGTVEEVSTDVSGRLLVKIDLGTNDSIRENMKLYVTRGGQFLANMTIIETDLNFAVGELDDLGLGTTVQAGDAVITRLQ